MKLANIFTDNMVLQRDKEISIFGTADGSGRITVSIDGLEGSVDIAGEGDWLVKLPPHAAGGPYNLRVEAVREDGGTYVEELYNVVYGEVWLANGQSNIEFEVQNCNTGKDELDNADYPDIRFYNVVKTAHIDDEVLRQESERAWHSCRNGSFRDMSAIGYYVALSLYRKLQVPVGIIDCYQGGTSVSCWMPEELLRSTPEGTEIIENYYKAIEGQTEEEYDEKLAEFNAKVEYCCSRQDEYKNAHPGATQEDIDAYAGPFPWPPPMGKRSLYRPCGLFASMIKRVAPFGVRGILYYQGEEDSQRYTAYEKLLSQMIGQYRKEWNETLPVLLFQLPMFIGKETIEDPRDWAGIREAQEAVASKLDNVSMVALTDLGEYDNVHPVDKKTPGERGGEKLLGWIYGVENSKDYMSLDKAVRTDNDIVLSFKNGEGLHIGRNDLIDLRMETETDSYTRDRRGWDDSHIYGLEVSADGEEWFAPEMAEISDNKLVIREASDVKYIRYAYFDYGRVNIYNGQDMPLIQFSVEVR